MDEPLFAVTILVRLRPSFALPGDESIADVIIGACTDALRNEDIDVVNAGVIETEVSK